MVLDSHQLHYGLEEDHTRGNQAALVPWLIRYQEIEASYDSSQSIISSPCACKLLHKITEAPGCRSPAPATDKYRTAYCHFWRPC